MDPTARLAQGTCHVLVAWLAGHVGEATTKTTRACELLEAVQRVRVAVSTGECTAATAVEAIAQRRAALAIVSDAQEVRVHAARPSRRAGLSGP